MNGAAYGDGIYLSPDSGTSFGYSSRYTPHHVSIAPSYIQYESFLLQNSSSRGDDTLAGKTNINCIALCEGSMNNVVG